MTAGCGQVDAGAPTPPLGADAGRADGGAQLPLAQQGRARVRVVDLEGRPVAAARVTVGAEAPITTDREGIVELTVVAPAQLVARVNAAGFAETATRLEVLAGATAVRELVVLPLGPRLTLDATSGGTLRRGGVSVTLPPRALVDSAGLPVLGLVDATIVPLDPTRHLAASPMPLEATSAAGPVSLESVMMAEVSFWRGDERLALAPGAHASLELELPEALATREHDGARIPAWYYDVAAGIWREDGAGMVHRSTSDPTRLVWTVEVSHFTWWNCDHPWTEKDCIRVRYVDSVTGLPLSARDGFTAVVEGVSYVGQSYSQLGDDGSACVDFKLGETARVVPSVLLGYRVEDVTVLDVVGRGSPSTCLGEGGSCQELTVRLRPPTCVSGTVQDAAGRGVADALVLARFRDERLQPRVSTARTGADGSYCVGVGPNVDVDVRAEILTASGALESRDLHVRSLDGASCGSGSCVPVAPLVPSAPVTDACIVVGDSGFMGAAAWVSGLPVHVFAGEVRPTCTPGADTPDHWGVLLSTMPGMSGRTACLQIPRVEGVAIVLGDCSDTFDGGVMVLRPGDEVVRRAPVGACGLSSSCGTLDATASYTYVPFPR